MHVASCQCYCDSVGKLYPGGKRYGHKVVQSLWDTQHIDITKFDSISGADLQSIFKTIAKEAPRETLVFCVTMGSEYFDAKQARPT